MKKLLWIPIIALLFCLVACKDNNDNQQNDKLVISYYDNDTLIEAKEYTDSVSLMKYSKTEYKFIGWYLDQELTITRRHSDIKIPRDRYVLGIVPYLNKAEYDEFFECSYESETFGEQISDFSQPEQFYGRTIEFKFTYEDCFENCDTCTTSGLTLDDQQCDTCKIGFYFIENTKNCVYQTPEGYYYDNDKKIYSKCYHNCKTCTTIYNGTFQICLSCKENYLLYEYINCILDCKSNNTYLNYEQTECIDSVPDGYYVNDTEYNIIDKCKKKKLQLQ